MKSWRRYAIHTWKLLIAVAALLGTYALLFAFSNLGWRAYDTIYDLLHDHQRIAIEDLDPRIPATLDDIKYENFHFSKYASNSARFREFIIRRLPIGTDIAVVDELLIKQGGATKRRLNAPSWDEAGGRVERYEYKSWSSALQSLAAFAPHNGFHVVAYYSPEHKLVKIVASGAP